MCVCRAMTSLARPPLRKQEGSGDSSIVYLCKLTENWCVQSNCLPAHLVTWISVLSKLIGGKLWFLFCLNPVMRREAGACNQGNLVT